MAWSEFWQVILPPEELSALVQSAAIMKKTIEQLELAS